MRTLPRAGLKERVHGHLDRDAVCERRLWSGSAPGLASEKFASVVLRIMGITRILTTLFPLLLSIALYKDSSAALAWGDVLMAESRSNDSSERTIVVTGAGTHLGRSIALRLLRDGFRCVLSGLNQTLLRKTVELSGEDGSRSVVVGCDIRIPEDRRRLIATAVEQPGQLYGLINNAAVFRFAPLFEENLTDWRDTLETNVEAAFFLSQLAIEVMRNQRRGRIVNIASMHGVVAVSNYGRGAGLPETSDGDRGPVRCSAYATSKGALIQLTRELAVAAGRWGITVNAVSPGTIPQPRNRSPDDVPVHPSSWRPKLTDDDYGSILAELARQVPLGRLASVEDVAGPVRFLLSDDAAYITGANLVVDGGFTVW